MLDPKRLLKDAAPGKAFEFRCGHCQRRVLLITAKRSDGLEYMALHLVTKHDLGNVMLEGQDFFVAPTPYRCDLCLGLAEPPWWTYITKAATGFQVADPRWLVCDICHMTILGVVTGVHGGDAHLPDPLGSLVERSMLIQKATFILDDLRDEDLREHLRSTMAGFLLNKFENPVRGND